MSLAEQQPCFANGPDDQQGPNLTFVRESQRMSLTSRAGTFLYRWRFSAGIAAGIAASLMILALLNFQADFQSDHLSIKIGLLSETGAGDGQVSRQEFQHWQIQSIKLMDQMLQESEVQQNIAVQNALIRLTEGLQQQRYADLQRVGQGLELFQHANQTRLNESQNLIEQLARNIQGQPVVPKR